MVVATSACSFPTGEFSLGGSVQTDVPTTDAPPVDADGVDVPTTDLGPADVPATPDAGDAADGAAVDVDDAQDVGATDSGPATDAGCPAGRMLCAGACVDPLNSVNHCGRCNLACNSTNGSAVCADGRCEVTCRTGFANCDLDPRNGCEVSLGTTTHCRSCGDACPAGAALNGTSACTAGVCRTTCAAGFADCNGMIADGCEAPLNTDAINCGMCGVVCRSHSGSSNPCAAGACTPTCNPGYGNCNGSANDGCEVSLATNSNCGACGRACLAGQVCRSGLCAVAATVNYAVSSRGPVFVDACAIAGSGRLLPGMDDAGALTPLPFGFTFWGAPLAAGRMVNVSTNGFISLDGAVDNGLQGIVPDPAAPNGVIAAWWTDLFTSSTGICTATTGAAPARRFLVQWSSVAYFASRSTDMNFEVVLNEQGGFIDLVYQRLAPLPPRYVPTVGLESMSGVQGSFLCTTAGLTCTVAAGNTFRYTPN